MKAAELTDRESEVLVWIEASIDAGYPPTVRELADSMGFSSTNAIVRYLDSLEAKGAIERDKIKSRGIRIVGRKCPHCGRTL